MRFTPQASGVGGMLVTAIAFVIWVFAPRFAPASGCGQAR
jgi:hypothetical protein